MFESIWEWWWWWWWRSMCMTWSNRNCRIHRRLFLSFSRKLVKMLLCSAHLTLSPVCNHSKKKVHSWSWPDLSSFRDDLGKREKDRSETETNLSNERNSSASCRDQKNTCDKQTWPPEGKKSRCNIDKWIKRFQCMWRKMRMRGESMCLLQSILTLSYNIQPCLMIILIDKCKKHIGLPAVRQRSAEEISREKNE